MSYTHGVPFGPLFLHPKVEPVLTQQDHHPTLSQACFAYTMHQLSSGSCPAIIISYVPTEGDGEVGTMLGSVTWRSDPSPRLRGLMTPAKNKKKTRIRLAFFMST